MCPACGAGLGQVAAVRPDAEIERLRVKAVTLLQRLEDGDDPQTAMDDLWNALWRKEGE
jgi:hypothetical protein